MEKPFLASLYIYLRWLLPRPQVAFFFQCLSGYGRSSQPANPDRPTKQKAHNQVPWLREKTERASRMSIENISQVTDTSSSLFGNAAAVSY